MSNDAGFEEKLLKYPDVFQELISFLTRCNFIHNFKVTEFLRRRVWDSVPNEWMTALTEISFEELNEVPYHFTKESWPQSLLTFLSDAKKLSSFHLASNFEICPLPIEDNCRFGMSPKKLHEVSHLATLIDNVCRNSNCKYIVDIGSGLGYLDLVLCRQLGYKVLGLENQTGRVASASKRTNLALKKEAIDLMAGTFVQRHFELTDNEESFLQLESIISEVWPSSPGLDVKDICLIGLHCCGDLTPAALGAFSHISRAKCIVCLGCCYHRMKPEGTGFVHFPLSSALKDAISESPHVWEITMYALRLAAQETRSRWRQQTDEDHLFHMRSVAYRGLFELNDDLSFMKQKRKLVRRNEHSDFGSYVDEVMKRTTLSDFEDVKNHLIQLHIDYEQNFAFIEPFTLLQVMVQPVLERLIIEDRVAFLVEQRLHAGVQTVFDDSISPRNFAIVASKD